MAEARGSGPAPAVTGIQAAAPAVLRDAPEHWPVTQSAELARGRLLRARRDTVAMPDGTHADRELTEHPGAVAILALDEADRVLLIRQYRHPAGALLWEIPAGLRDVTGEPLLAAAQRELLEETGYRAADWRVLTDFFTSPGSSTERVRVFLARGLTEVPAAERDYVPEYEEASLQVAWAPLEEAVRGFLAGDLHNGVAAVGILSAYAAVTAGFGGLRETGAPETL
jgi:8-oxo-dGTP pyrophosphatase MutT (NUDIX family)